MFTRRLQYELIKHVGGPLLMEINALQKRFRRAGPGSVPRSAARSASSIRGREPRARATRTRSRAVPVSQPTRQLNHWAQETAPCWCRWRWRTAPGTASTARP